jgi:hypothetical protein
MRLLLPLALLVACRSETGQRPLDEPERPHLALLIDEPPPAAWLGLGQTAVSGRYDNLGDLALDGAAIAYDAGAFSSTYTPSRGTNRVTLTGRSRAGTVYETHNAVIAGAFAPPDAPIARGVAARVNKGGLDRLGALAAAALTVDALRPALVTGEPLTAWSEGDTTVLVEITDLAFERPEIGIAPRDGSGRLSLALHALDLGVALDATSGRLSASLTQRATADRVQVTGDLAVRVVDGAVRTSLTNVDVKLDGLRFDTSRLPSWLQGSFTDLVIQVVLEGVLRGVLPDIVPPIVDAQLATLDLSVDLTLAGRSIRAAARIADAGFDPDGLRIDADVSVTVDGALARTAPGYLSSPLTEPSPDRRADLALAVRDDVLNLAAFHAWRADLIGYRLSTDDESLPPFVFEALGGSRHGAVTASADLPPTFIDVDGALRAQIGELALRIDTEDGRNGEYLVAAASGHADLGLSVVAGVLKIAVGRADVALAVRDTDWTDSLPEATAQLDALLPIDVALALLSDIALPLPTLGELTIAGAGAARDPSGLHTNVAIDLGD